MKQFKSDVVVMQCFLGLSLEARYQWIQDTHPEIAPEDVPQMCEDMQVAFMELAIETVLAECPHRPLEVIPPIAW